MRIRKYIFLFDNKGGAIACSARTCNVDGADSGHYGDPVTISIPMQL